MHFLSPQVLVFDTWCVWLLLLLLHHDQGGVDVPAEGAASPLIQQIEADLELLLQVKGGEG
jgi:hypothetical protein